MGLVPSVWDVPAAGASAFGLGPLFLVFLKVRALLFGSGHVLLAFLHGDLVQRLGPLPSGSSGTRSPLAR